ncbi:PAS domain-containing protein [Oscillibacter sp.]|uniref:PAS domain-containing protein n=1 Tax=Oscillibacter sp. TaxID=1945593 RepID=UPI002623AFB0|nr:PAS domain-containing protein [Oscillibacter sp.]
MTEDICWFGTSDHEDIHTIAEARDYISDEIALMPRPYEMTFTSEADIRTGETSGTALLRMTIANAGISIAVRATASSRLENGQEKLCCIHFSVSDPAQQPQEYYPVAVNRKKLANARIQLVQSTMAGGLIGGYMKPGFPFYTVGKRMLEYLGYADEADFVADIGGLIINGIHPEDRACVYAAVEKQLQAGDQYAVDYRLRKKDGSYIWVHDIGRKNADADGQPVILSVCYDITEEHQKQAQLDNLINALPGGVALYRLADGRLEVLYHSRGVGALSGRTPEEYAELMLGGGKDSIYPEDADKVFSAIEKAAQTEETVSLDYRVPCRTGGCTWISGSFKRAGMDRGCPIVHAVFTEMAQMRELLGDITENSGVAVIVSDNTTRELLYVNREALAVCGKTDRNYEGQVCYAYLFGRDTPCENCRGLCAEHFEAQAREISIADRYYMAQGRLVSWAGRQAHIEYLTDISETKYAQKKLLEMLQNVACGIVVSRANPINHTYEVQYMNEGFCKLFEDTEEALRVRYRTDLTVGAHPEDVEKIRKMAAELSRTMSHAEGTLRFLFPGGRVKWLRLEVNAVAQPDGMMATYASYYDVTAQVQQEQQLRDVIHNVPGGVCLYRWDGRKLHPLIVSEQFSALLGEDARRRMAETTGTQYIHVHPDDLPGLQRAIAKTFEESGKIEYTYRSRNKKTNDYRWIYMQGVAVAQADGTQLAYVSYTDVTDQHLLTQKLRASERALDFATEEAGFWYWRYDPALDCAYFNERSMRDFGLPPVLENFPQSWLDTGFLFPEYADCYRACVQKIKEGEPQVRFEARIRDLRGETHWTEFRFSSLPDEHGRPGLAVCTGRIIDYEKALLEKYELEKQKPSLGEKDLLFHAIFNLDTGETTDYGFTGGTQPLSGDYTTFESAISHVADSIIDADAKAKFLEMNSASYLKAQVQQGNISLSMDYRRRLPDGRLLWVRNILHPVSAPNTKHLMLFEYCYDIHAQKMAEEVLHSATTYDYERIASVDFVAGTIIPYGDIDALPSGGPFDYDTVLRDYASSTVIPEERAQFMENSAPETVAAHVAKENSYDFTTKIRKADGSVGVVKTRFVPYDAAHQIYIMARTDVTDLLHGEEVKNAVLQEALEVAQQANSAKSDFLAAMSHDIRTPMNAIVGMCELAIADENDHGQVHESLKTIQSSSQLLLSLINNILDMSRIESGKMVLTNEPFSLTQEVAKTTQSYKILAAQKNQTFQLHLNIKHDCCSGDIGRIHSALDNILSNVIKYTPAGGTVTYRVSEIASQKPDLGWYRFEISDTGMGISEEKQKHLFEPFYRGQDAATAKIEGTGLGLSITKAIVDLKGGTISLKSTEGVGTTFVVELPLHFASGAGEPVQQKSSGDRAGPYDLSGLRILLCEDHPVNQKVAARILEKAGASVQIAEDGQAGYEAFLTQPSGAFDIILMDIRMPRMDGYAATRAIRESNHPQAKTIPIVAMTANAFSEDVQRSRKVGMNAHLAKPIVPTQLYETVSRLVGSRSQRKAAKVLFVDDVELNIAVLTAAISDEYEVFVARNGAEALDTLESNPDIAAVITDIMMPEIDGFTLIKTIRANPRYNRVALLANTQYGDAKQEEALLALGADDFLYKPTTSALVQSRLKSALRKYRQ